MGKKALKEELEFTKGIMELFKDETNSAPIEFAIKDIEKELTNYKEKKKAKKRKKKK